jgi:ElaB/YqjD/DUF883 family membrane-anchored ribosome-binding protein
MPNIKPLEDASQDFAADLAALRDDIAKLTASVSALVRAQASATTDTVLGAVEQARRKLSEGAADAKDHVGTVGPDIEAAIERNPLTAVLVAMAAGLLIGILSRSRK